MPSVSSEQIERIEQRLKQDQGRLVERLFSLFQDKCLPDEVFHSLACACAERVLFIERQEGREPASESWKAVEEKKAWLYKEIDDAALSQAVSDARKAAHQASIKASGYEAAASAADAASDVSYALRAVAWSLSGIEKTVPPAQREMLRKSEEQWIYKTFLSFL